VNQNNFRQETSPCSDTRQIPPERVDILEYYQSIIDKYLKINQELLKYRVWKALKANVEKESIRQDYVSRRCQIFIKKRNKRKLDSIVHHWRDVAERAQNEYKVKLNHIGERNYARIIAQTF
jgi:nitric oxide reductase large subunit